MERWDAIERENLLTSLRETAPEAPTLCEGWQARHLATHLYLRRHRPWQSFRQGEGSVFATLADEASDPVRYAEVVEKFAATPDRFSPMRLQDGPLGMVSNHLEYVIHHEDLRRGAGPVPPRSLPAEQADAVFDGATRFGKMALRKAAVGVVFVVPGGRRTVVHKGDDAVAVVGTPVDLALVAAGRRRAADVELRGAEDAVTTFEAATA